jgi:vitamin-K-epoxide reductase (warfarin-sensitive)
VPPANNSVGQLHFEDCRYTENEVEPEVGLRFVIAILAVAGIVVSSLALQVHYSTDVQPCSINEKWDCGIVNHSRFAEFAHVPVAAIGIAGYALLGMLALLRFKRLLLAASLLGLAFALYLTNIEAHVLQVWCLYCVISQGIIALLAICAAITAFWPHRRKAA